MWLLFMFILWSVKSNAYEMLVSIKGFSLSNDPERVCGCRTRYFFNLGLILLCGITDLSFNLYNYII